MRRTRRLVLFPFLLLPLLGSCADGGSRGTGITTAQGNVAGVIVATRPAPRDGRSFGDWLAGLFGGPREAAANGGVGGIQVVLEGSDLATMTDPNGLFSLQGNFGGPVALRFLRPEDGLDARIVIDPPAGAILTLNDVRIERGRARDARRDIRFDGLVTETRCTEEWVRTVSRFRPDDGNSYVVRVGGRALRDETGSPRSCTSLAGGEALRTDGIVNADGTIGAFDAEVRSGSGRRDPSEPSEPSEPDDPSEPDVDNSGPGNARDC